jgi:hypothetical protein
MHLNPSEPKTTITLGRSSARLWWKRYGLVVVLTAAYFFILSGALLYKRRHLLDDWPVDQAYMIQQFHNWWSGQPVVTIRPGDQRSGFPGQHPFDERHQKWIYLFYKVLYRLWPQPETLILVYAFLVSLAVPTLYLFLAGLGVARPKITALLFVWMLYPLNQKIAVYTYCDPLSYCGTFYFFYLYLLGKDSRYSFIGCLLLLLPREETCLLVLPTFLLLPEKWKTLLWHVACLLPFLLLSRHGAGNPVAYAAASFDPSFITNFALTQTILWVLALVNARALFIVLAFFVAMICVGGEIYFQFPSTFLGSSFTPPGGYYYYGLLTPALMAAVALGISRLKPYQGGLDAVCFALLLVPGALYGLGQFGLLAQSSDEASAIESYQAANVSSDAVVVTDLKLSALFANRNAIYVYLLTPLDTSVDEMFSRAQFAFLRKADAPAIEAGILSHSPRPWHRVLETANHVVYQKD